MPHLQPLRGAGDCVSLGAWFVSPPRCCCGPDHSLRLAPLLFLLPVPFHSLPFSWLCSVIGQDEDVRPATALHLALCLPRCSAKPQLAPPQLGRALRHRTPRARGPVLSQVSCGVCGPRERSFRSPPANHSPAKGWLGPFFPEGSESLRAPDPGLHPGLRCYSSGD